MIFYSNIVYKTDPVHMLHCIYRKIRMERGGALYIQVHATHLEGSIHAW